MSLNGIVYGMCTCMHIPVILYLNFNVTNLISI